MDSISLSDDGDDIFRCHEPTHATNDEEGNEDELQIPHKLDIKKNEGLNGQTDNDIHLSESQDRSELEKDADKGSSSPKLGSAINSIDREKAADALTDLRAHPETKYFVF